MIQIRPERTQLHAARLSRVQLWLEVGLRFRTCATAYPSISSLSGAASIRKPHYKAGTRSLGKASRELFVLNLKGRVVPADWEGFSFRGSKLWDTYGKELTHGVLRAYLIALQMRREWARGDALLTRTLDEIFYTRPHALPHPTPGRLERSDKSPADDAQTPALVRRPRPETIRRRSAAV